MNNVSKKKILIRIGSLGGGGAEKVLIQYLDNLDYTQFEVDLLLNIKYGVYLEKLNKNVNLYWLSTYYGTENFIKRQKGKVENKLKEWYYKKHPEKIYAKILNNKKYDIEIAFIQSIIPEILKSPNKKSKKIGWIHSDIVNVTKQTIAAKEEVYKKIVELDKVIFVSDLAKTNLNNLLGHEHENFVTLYNPIDSKKIKQLSEEVKANENEKFTFLTVGRFHEEKGYLEIIEVANELKNEDSISNIEFHFMGNGKLEEMMKAKISEYDLQDHIKIIPFQKNPYPAIKNVDAVLIYSENEGFSMVAAEAMVLNKYIISSKVSGIIDISNNGEYVQLIDRNRQALKLEILKTINNPNLIIEQGKKLNNKTFKFAADLIYAKFDGILKNI